MLERRIENRRRIHEIASIAIDEHTSVPCLLYDLSDLGVRLTMPGTDAVPETFVLTSPSIEGARICMVAWRDDETIGARFYQRLV